MNEYEESNATIQARHPKLFKDVTSKFKASKELVMFKQHQHQTDQIYKAH
jgi:hypothetical protein